MAVVAVEDAVVAAAEGVTTVPPVEEEDLVDPEEEQEEAMAAALGEDTAVEAMAVEVLAAPKPTVVARPTAVEEEVEEATGGGKCRAFTRLRQYRSSSHALSPFMRYLPA